MPFVLCRKADGRIRSASRWDAPDFDPATEVRLTIPTMPTDPATLRWDGTTGLRSETPQELANRQDARASALFDNELLLLAVARWTAQKLGVAPATAKQEILAIYRSLS